MRFYCTGSKLFILYLYRYFNCEEMLVLTWIHTWIFVLEIKQMIVMKNLCIVKRDYDVCFFFQSAASEAPNERRFLSRRGDFLHSHQTRFAALGKCRQPNPAKCKFFSFSEREILVLRINCIFFRLLPLKPCLSLFPSFISANLVSPKKYKHSNFIV